MPLELVILDNFTSWSDSTFILPCRVFKFELASDKSQCHCSWPILRIHISTVNQSTLTDPRSTLQLVSYPHESGGGTKLSVIAPGIGTNIFVGSSMFDVENLHVVWPGQWRPLEASGYRTSANKPECRPVIVTLSPRETEGFEEFVKMVPLGEVREM